MGPSAIGIGPFFTVVAFDREGGPGFRIGVAVVAGQDKIVDDDVVGWVTSVYYYRYFQRWSVLSNHLNQPTITFWHFE